MKTILRAILRRLLIWKVALKLKQCREEGHTPLAVHVHPDNFKPGDHARFGLPFVHDPLVEFGKIRIKTENIWDEVMLAHLGGDDDENEVSK